MVAWFGAVQAQDYAGAKWALGLRARDLADSAVEEALSAGVILRTHVLRPTWHFVHRDDIRWLQALTGPRVQRMSRGYARTLGLDERTLNRGRAVVERALEGGTYLTREELSIALARAKIHATGQRLAHLLIDIELQAIICSGPRRGKHFTYALVSHRAPTARLLPRDEALATLTTRYFQSHGPATLKDYSWWSGLTMKEAREGAALAGVNVLNAPPGPERVADATFLLPNYDEYLIAYRDRGAVIDPARARNLGVFTTLEFPHHLIVDGRVAGTWKRRMAERLVIEVRRYGRLSRAQMETVTAQAARYGRFLGLEVAIRHTFQTTGTRESGT